MSTPTHFEAVRIFFLLNINQSGAKDNNPIDASVEELLEPEGFQVALQAEIDVPGKMGEQEDLVTFLVSKVFYIKAGEATTPEPGGTRFRINDDVLALKKEELSKVIEEAIAGG